MGKKDRAPQHLNKNQHQQREKGKLELVLEILRKQSPLTLKQEKFCNSECVQRFLKSKGDNVKKAAKQLRSCISWRDSIGIENLMADEFSAELSEGVAYVAGHDHESRPVMVIRIKQDYQKFHSQKLFSRLMAFTLEVAIQTMSSGNNASDQFVVLFDASFFRSASAFINLLLAALKIMAEYYPGRLYRAFVIDAPLLFSYLWKGVRPFTELSTVTTTVSSTDFDDDDIIAAFNTSTYRPRASSLRFHPPSSTTTSNIIGPCASSRFSFTVSHHFDSLKPWYLSLTDSSPSSSSSAKVGPALIAAPNARSFSFASPATRHTPGDRLARKCFIPSTPMPRKTYNADAAAAPKPRTPRPSFLHSPAEVLFGGRKDAASAGAFRTGKAERSREAFYPYLKFYRKPYDEMLYRAKMKPPLGGLASIVANPHHHQRLRRRHVSVSQRY